MFIDKIVSLFSGNKDKEDISMNNDTNERIFPRIPDKKYKIDYKYIEIPKGGTIVPFDRDKCLSDFLFIVNNDSSQSTFICFKDGSRLFFNNWVPSIEGFESIFFQFDSTDSNNSYYGRKNFEHNWNDHYSFSPRQYEYMKEELTKLLISLFEHSVRYHRICESECYIGSTSFTNLKENETVFINGPDIGNKFPYYRKDFKRWNYTEAVILEDGRILDDFLKCDLKDLEHAKLAISHKELKRLGYPNNGTIYDFENDKLVKAKSIVDYKVKLLDRICEIANEVKYKEDKFKILTDNIAIESIVENIIHTYLKENNKDNVELDITAIYSMIESRYNNDFYPTSSFIEMVLHSDNYEDLIVIEKKINDFDIDKVYNLDYYKRLIIDAIGVQLNKNSNNE